MQWQSNPYNRFLFMAEPKELHPLDEQFRKSFDELSSAPSANGWDTPSAKVWEHVQENIKTPRQTWSKWALVVLGLAVAILGLWAYFQSLPKPEPAAQPTPELQEQPATQPLNNNVDAAPVDQNGTSAQKPAGSKPTKTTPLKPPPATVAEPLPSSSKPLPGAKKVFPNNTERNKRGDGEDNTSDENAPSKPLPKKGGGSY